MDFNLSEDEQLLERTVRDFVAREYSFERRQAIIESPEGWSRDVWRQLAEIGVLGVGVPAACGGLDAGPVPAMLVMNAVGAALVVEPVLTSAVVATALLRGVDDAEHRRDLLPAMAAGESIVALAHQEPETQHGAMSVATRAERTGAGYVIRGRKTVVAHAPAADTFLISAGIVGSAREAPGLSLFRVPRATPGLKLARYRSLDGQVAGDLELDAVELPAEARVGPEHAAASALGDALDVGVAAVCAEAVGALAALLDTTAEYLRTRKQFGRPIGSFQALQHRAADMLIHCEQAKSMSYLATLRGLGADPRERRRALSAAKVLIGRACRFVGQQAVQLHGGMGMTDELNVSHYFKRLTAIELAFGDADFHLDRFIDTWREHPRPAEGA